MRLWTKQHLGRSWTFSNVIWKDESFNIFKDLKIYIEMEIHETVDWGSDFFIFWDNRLNHRLNFNCVLCSSKVWGHNKLYKIFFCSQFWYYLFDSVLLDGITRFWNAVRPTWATFQLKTFIFTSLSHWERFWIAFCERRFTNSHIAQQNIIWK